jgi:hypothetical protein
MNPSRSLRDVVAGILSEELGLAGHGELIRTLALREGHLVAEKFRYDGGYAIWSVGGRMVEFYDDDGNLVKCVPLVRAAKSDAA